MAKMTTQQVYALARGAGLSPSAAVMATAIAAGESGLNPDAVGDVGIQTSKWGPSVGLWQIRSVKAESGKGTARDATRLKDPTFNAKAMAEVSGLGKNFKPWSVYLHGTYKQYLGQTVTVAKGVDGDPTALDKLLAGVANLPGVGAVSGAVSGPASAVSGAVGDAVSSLNPFSTWQADAQGVLLKTAIVVVAGGLFVAGAMRLVVPAAVSETRRAVGV